MVYVNEHTYTHMKYLCQLPVGGRLLISCWFTSVYIFQRVPPTGVVVLATSTPVQ